MEEMARPRRPGQDDNKEDGLYDIWGRDDVNKQMKMWGCGWEDDMDRTMRMWWGQQDWDADKDADKDSNKMTGELRYKEDVMTWRRWQG